MTPQRVVPAVALVVVLLAIGYALLPFKFADTVACKAPLMGGGPKETATTVGFIQPGPDCRRRGKSRLAAAAVVAMFAVAAGAGALLVPPESRECREGDHDNCHGRWPVSLGFGEESGTCQCSCHG